MTDSIAEYMRKFTKKSTPHELSFDMTSSAVHQISAPIPAELYKQLKAMAADYNYDANCVTGDLLGIALTQALAYLSDEDAQHVA